MPKFKEAVAKNLFKRKAVGLKTVQQLLDWKGVCDDFVQSTFARLVGKLFGD